MPEELLRVLQARSGMLQCLRVRFLWQPGKIVLGEKFIGHPEMHLPKEQMPEELLRVPSQREKMRAVVSLS